MESTNPSFSRPSVAEYLQAFQDLDFRDHHIVDRILVSSWRRVPGDPGYVYLGQDQSYYYVLDRTYFVITDDRPSSDGDEQSGSCTEYMTHPARARAVVKNARLSVPRYGLTLGQMKFLPKPLHQNMSATESAWIVVMDAIDKSLWLVVDFTYDGFYHMGPSGACHVNPWKYLPIEQDGREQFDVIQIMAANELFTTGPRDFSAFDPSKHSDADLPHNKIDVTINHEKVRKLCGGMFDDVMLQTAQRCFLNTYSAVSRKWDEAIERQKSYLQYEEYDSNDYEFSSDDDDDYL